MPLLAKLLSGSAMKYLMMFSRAMDAFSVLLGKVLMWVVLVVVLISAGNAVSRYAFNLSSNAWLEIQWYLFGAVFLLGSGFVFLRNAHVRIDVVAQRLSARTRNWIDIIGILAVLLPMCYLMATLGWPIFERAWHSGEMSSNAGGLIRWPAYLLIPVGFVLLGLQGISEVIKRLNFLFCHGPDPLGSSAGPEVQVPVTDVAASNTPSANASGQKS